MRAETIKKEFRRRIGRVPELGERHTLCDWVRDEDESPFYDMHRYGELLSLLPDKIVENLEKARLSRAGVFPAVKAGYGYEEMLAAIIVDGTAIASSSAEARLAPSIMVGINYMQPGNIPGRCLTVKARGRGTTLTTAATMTMRQRIAATDVITGTTLCATGAMAADTTAQTASQWEYDSAIITRSVGSAGTVFAQGRAGLAWHVQSSGALQMLSYAGSAGHLAPAAVTWDMAAGQYLQFTGQWSLATAYSITCHQYRVEALN
jgi:hypothetical protein